MAGSKFTAFSAGDANLTALMDSVATLLTGYNALFLDSYTTTVAPKIAAESYIENDGILYYFANEETPNGSPSNGTTYIRLIPDIAGTITAEYSNSVPIFIPEKNGWYDSDVDYTRRYVAACFNTSGVYTLKRDYRPRNAAEAALFYSIYGGL